MASDTDSNPEELQTKPESTDPEDVTSKTPTGLEEEEFGRTKGTDVRIALINYYLIDSYSTGSSPSSRDPTTWNSTNTITKNAFESNAASYCTISGR